MIIIVRIKKTISCIDCEWLKLKQNKKKHQQQTNKTNKNWTIRLNKIGDKNLLLGKSTFYADTLPFFLGSWKQARDKQFM